MPGWMRAAAGMANQDPVSGAKGKGTGLEIFIFDGIMETMAAAIINRNRKGKIYEG